MSNLVCMAVSKLDKNAEIEFNKDIGPERTFRLYKAMSEIVMHSCETFIQEDFDFVIFEDEVDNYQQIFDKNFSNVYDAWNDEGPNNILFLDTDTLVISPLEIFGTLEDFQLFNYTDPKRLEGADANNKYGLQHQHYFNAGVRYYPDTMKKEVWDLGWSYANDWDYNIWGTEQIIFNEMMFSQNRDVKHWLNPEMNYQILNVPFKFLDDFKIQEELSNWNNLNINDAKIVHLHGTRSAPNTLMLQWELWKRVSGEEFEFSEVKILKDETGSPISLDFIE